MAQNTVGQNNTHFNTAKLESWNIRISPGDTSYVLDSISDSHVNQFLTTWPCRHRTGRAEVGEMMVPQRVSVTTVERKAIGSKTAGLKEVEKRAKHLSGGKGIRLKALPAPHSRLLKINPLLTISHLPL